MRFALRFAISQGYDCQKSLVGQKILFCRFFAECKSRPTGVQSERLRKQNYSFAEISAKFLAVFKRGRHGNHHTIIYVAKFSVAGKKTFENRRVVFDKFHACAVSGVILFHLLLQNGEFLGFNRLFRVTSHGMPQRNCICKIHILKIICCKNMESFGYTET